MNTLTPFETLEPAEEQNTTHIIEVMRRKQEKDFAPGSTKRDAHAKHTALLQAVFTVESDLPPEMRVGLFAEPRSFEAWVRFSNSQGTWQSDKVKDVRGCAIKVRDVPGNRIPESDDSSSQDFVLLSMPTMPLGTVSLFHDAISLANEWSPLLFLGKMLITGHARNLLELAVGRVAPTSPLDLRYWSTTPYLFGDRAAKYSLVPTSTIQSTLPTNPSDDYLSENVQTHLARGEATFDFKVQLRTDPPSMPIEDAAVEWSEGKAPFVKVATLRISNQEFRTAERNELSEALAFSPGHSLIEHRPIGAVNRARMRIYREQALFRQQRDQRRRVT